MKDPVCGMDVVKNKLSSGHGGVTYYFCSAGCKSQFDKNPDKYVK